LSGHNSTIWFLTAECMSSSVREYRIKGELAQGRSGTVDLAVSKRGSLVVIKKMNKGDLEGEWVQNEIRAGQLLRRQKGILQFREHFEDDHNDYLVSDYVDGQDLFTFIQKRDFAPMKEREAKFIIKQVAHSLYVCHKKGIAHKDIKLENICIDKRLRTTLIDFGFCEFSPSGYLSCRWDGTPEYASPEVLLNVPFSPQKSDVFSLGVVLFTLVTGVFPFDHHTRCRLLKKGGKPEVDWTVEYLPSLSRELRNLLDQMLECNAEARLSLKQVLKHKWMKRGLTEIPHALLRIF